MPKVIKILNKIPLIRRISNLETENERVVIQNGSLKLEKKKLEIRLNDMRVYASYRWLKGEGIEIGALHNPLPYDSENASVKYVDKYPLTKLKKQYSGIEKAHPEIKNLTIVNPDFVDDGEKLDSFKDDSLDFIIANHMLEHCRNPIKTIETHLKKIRTNGILFYAIPDKRFTFDKKRDLTTIEHLKNDYLEKNDHSKHYTEWVKDTEGYTDTKEIKARIKFLKEIDYSIHYHVWNMNTLVEFFIFLTDFKPVKNKFTIEAIILNGGEVITILRKI